MSTPREGEFEIDVAFQIIDEIECLYEWAQISETKELLEPFGTRLGWNPPESNEFNWIDVLIRHWSQSGDAVSASEVKELESYIAARSLMWVLGHKLAESLCLKGETRPRRYPLVSVRKSVLVRDDSTCQSCGTTWNLPLSTYDEIQIDDILPKVTVKDADQRTRNRRARGRLRDHQLGPNADHIIPPDYWGPSDGWNLWVLCYRCNQRKARLLWAPALRIAVERLQSGNDYASKPPPDEEFSRPRMLR